MISYSPSEINKENHHTWRVAYTESTVDEDNDDLDDYDFTNYVSRVLDPGTYFLTLTQNLGANHLIQMIYDKKVHSNISTNRCFEFSLDIQAQAIDKPDVVSTKKFEGIIQQSIRS